MEAEQLNCLVDEKKEEICLYKMPEDKMTRGQNVKTTKIDKMPIWKKFQNEEKN